MIRRRVLYVLFIVLFLFSCDIGAEAQESDTETFPNGLTVSGEFLKLYRSVDDPERLFGMPYTSVFIDPFPPGKQVQYFDRVRMEYDPTQPEGQRIALAELGKFAHSESEPGQPIPSAPNMCRTVNGKSVCYAFRDLYDRYGERIFGLPITEAEYDKNGRFVQYFTRGRMEWRVEMPPGKRVVLTELGKIDFEKRIANPRFKDPNEQRLQTSIEPKLYAFVARPLLANGNKQSVFALLYDQYDRPIEGAKITVTLRPPAGAAPIPNPPSQTTNKDGYASVEFPVANIQPNQPVDVIIEAQMENLPEAEATTWFRVWW
ncbi:MAG: hypothetical protein EHM21_04020 [Chloroflexi bacterium]|nr:MAG: hypothetical protein EHM21_04020 [Chloroflexota bacterium]